MADTPILRAATPSDMPALADTFISGVNLSIPGRKLGEEFYALERDIAPGEPGVSDPGKLWTRFQEQFEKEHIWLAETDGRVVGYISWYDPTWSEEAGHKPGEITYLFVHPSFHGRGIGKKLLSHAKQHVEAGVNDLTGEALLEVRCFVKNPAGLKLYERGGFVRKHGADEFHERVGEYLALLVWSK
ncbi:acyl-CoA N-acyltransferase [Mycena rosella]|uniref:Acyl-CoA N-acyltransferase n=1 Tax=Mycena rosella TaxID=1033263 RepID=A0AAD7D7X0_MYCRO|nr:acyl-CoA N-acyltransferase [Mycena rosella]